MVLAWRGRELVRVTFILRKKYFHSANRGGAVASWLVRLSPDRAARIRALAGDIVLCSWARHFTLTVPLSAQVKKLGAGEFNAGGNPAMDRE